MELRHLQYFQKIAELQNVSKAAKELMVAQPALSRTLRTLETELDTTLFTREGKHLSLNENGRILYSYTSQILELMEQAKTEIRHNANSSHPIYISINSGSSIVPIVVSLFKKKYPDVPLQFANTSGNLSSEINILFDSDFNYESKKNSVPLLKEPCVLAFSSNHPFAQKSELQISDLQNETFLYADNCHSTVDMATFLTGLGGFFPKQQMECLGIESALSFLVNNLGILLLPTLTWNIKHYPSIKTYEFPEISLFRTFHITLTGPYEHNTNVSLFCDFCIDFFKKIQELGETTDLLHYDPVKLYGEQI